MVWEAADVGLGRDHHIRIYGDVPRLSFVSHISGLPIIFTLVFPLRHRVAGFTLNALLIYRHLMSMMMITMMLLSSTRLLLLQLAILPPRLLRRTRLLRPGPFRLNRTPALLAFLQPIQLLREDVPRELAVLLATPRLLALDHDARRQVAQLDGTGGLVDLLASGARALEELLFELRVEDLGAGWQCFFGLPGVAGEGAWADDRFQEVVSGRPCRVGWWGSEETWQHWQ